MKKGQEMAKKVAKKTKSAEKLLTNVAIVLDASGSMGAMQREAVDGFNQQVAELKKPANKKLGYRVSLVTFDSTVHEPKIWDKPVSKISELERKDYVTGGMTALLDAIGSTITKMEALPSNAKPQKGLNVANLLIIITDGQENQSKEYAAPNGYAKIKEKIEALQKKNWTFTFMGANMNVMEVACKGLGIHAGNTMCFVPTGAGYAAGAQGATGAVGPAGVYTATRSAGGQSVSSFYDPANKGKKA